MAARTIRVGVCAGLIGVLGLAAEASAGETPKRAALDYGAYVKKSETFPKVRDFCDQVIEHGRDKYGPKKLAIFVNAFDLTTKTPPPGPHGVGSLNGHRPGLCNLQLQASLLRLLWHMSDITGEPRYRKAVEACLHDYFQHVAHPETGDFPWGTHAGYDLTTDKISMGAAVEEKITDFPWEILYAVNPQGLLRLADRFRICFDKDMTTWFHHRPIGPTTEYLDPSPEFSTRGRQGNHPYLISAVVHAEAWALAWSKTKDPKYLEWLKRLLKTMEDCLLTPDALFGEIVNVHHHPPPGTPSTWTGPMNQWERRSQGVGFGSPYLWGHAMQRVARCLGEQEGRQFLDSGLRQMARWAKAACNEKDRYYAPNISVYPDMKRPGRGGRGGFWDSGGGGGGWGGGRLVTALLAYADAYKHTGRDDCRKVADQLDEWYVDQATFMDAAQPEHALLLGIYLHGLAQLYEKSGDARYLPRGRLARDKALRQFFRDGCFLGRPGTTLVSHDWGSDDLALAVLKWDMAEGGLNCPIPDAYLFDWGYGYPMRWEGFQAGPAPSPERCAESWRGLPPVQDPDQKAGK